MNLFGKILILSFVFFISLFSTFADPPGPPGPGGDPGTGGGIPVGAPIDNGVIVLLILGVSYAGWKYYSAWRLKKQAT
jgi:hypothetical protein